MFRVGSAARLEDRTRIEQSQSRIDEIPGKLRVGMVSIGGRAGETLRRKARLTLPMIAGLFARGRRVRDPRTDRCVFFQLAAFIGSEGPEGELYEVRCHKRPSFMNVTQAKWGRPLNRLGREKFTELCAVKL